MTQNQKAEEGVDFSRFFKKDQNEASGSGPVQRASQHRGVKMVLAIIFLLASLGALWYFMHEYTKTPLDPASYAAPAGYHMSNTPGEPPHLEKN